MISLKLSNEIVQKLLDFHSLIMEKKSEIDKGLESFTQFDKVKVLRVHYKMEEADAQYKFVDGTKNVWVVKPSFSARGLGIYCTD